MAVFVVLALALAAMAVGMVVVAVVVLRRQVQGLTGAIQATSVEVQRLAEELGEETAVLTLEAEAIQQRLASRRTSGSRRYTADTRDPAARS